jgi:hypothetical protein
MMTPIEVLFAVVDIGGKLGSVEGDALRTLLPRDCPPAIKDAIRAHRPGLLILLRANFLVVRADSLNAMIFWTPDDATKATLVAAGADPGTIYTAAELAQLVNRRVTAEELPAIHATKQRFAGCITQHDRRRNN